MRGAMQKEDGEKMAAAVALGRRGGKVKSKKKTLAARMNGWLGGPQSWTKPRHEWKKRDPNKVTAVNTKKRAKGKLKMKVTTPRRATPPVEQIVTEHRPR